MNLPHQSMPVHRGSASATRGASGRSGFGVTPSGQPSPGVQPSSILATWPPIWDTQPFPFQGDWKDLIRQPLIA